MEIGGIIRIIFEFSYKKCSLVAVISEFAVTRIADRDKRAKNVATRIAFRFRVPVDRVSGRDVTDGRAITRRFSGTGAERVKRDRVSVFGGAQ